MIKVSNNEVIAQALVEQYGAALAMLENCIISCDEQLFNDTKQEVIISQVIYHTLYFIDIYLSKNKEELEKFKGKLGENGDASTYIHEPSKVFLKKELIEYVQEIRIKTDHRLKELTFEALAGESLFTWHGSSVLSSLLYNLRHIMLHVGALHVRINAKGKEPLKWVSKAPLILKN